MPFFQAASNVNRAVDNVFFYTLAFSLVVLLGITTLVVVFVVRYSRKRHPHPVNVSENTALEVSWTAATTVIFLTMFVYGWTSFQYMRQAPRDAMIVDVTARQWSWSFKYPNGKVTPDLYLAANRPVKVLLHSADVIHGFYVPAFRVKSDVVPGQTNYAWFTPEQVGAFDLECTVICGPGHAHMLAKVYVVPEAAFKEWYFGPVDAPLPSPATTRPLAPAGSGTPEPDAIPTPASTPGGDHA